MGKERYDAAVEQYGKGNLLSATWLNGEGNVSRYLKGEGPMQDNMTPAYESQWQEMINRLGGRGLPSYSGSNRSQEFTAPSENINTPAADFSPNAVRSSITPPAVTQVPTPTSSPNTPSIGSSGNQTTSPNRRTVIEDLGMYAPIIGNMTAYGESLFESPEIEQYNRVAPTPLRERMVYTPVNSAYASDIIRNQYAGVARGINEMTGGNRGVGQTALLANDRNRAEALYNAAYQGDQLNFQRLAQVKGFNTQVDQFNAQQDLQSQMYNVRTDMQEKDVNAQNRAALRSYQNAARNTVLDNLQGLAQQIRWERLAPIITMGYDKYGQKVKG